MVNMRKDLALASAQQAFVVILVCTIFLSLGLHTLEFGHFHPGEPVSTHAGEEDSYLTTVYIHAMEEKFFLILVALIAVGGLFLWTTTKFFVPAVSVLAFLERSRCTYTKHRLVKLHSYFVLLFRLGILNPKLY